MKSLQQSILAFCCLCSPAVNAQLFCIGLGDPVQSNYSQDIRQCEGGYILAGSNSKEQGNAWMVRISEAGETVWSRDYGGQGLESGYRVASQADGFLLISQFQADTGGNYGIWILKTDLDGNPLWDKHIVGENWEIGEGLITLPDTGFVLLSTRYLSARDLVIRRFTKNGDQVWEKGFFGEADERGKDILLAQNGLIYIAGETKSGQSDILFAAFNTNGDSLFKKTSGSIYDDFCSGITEEGSGKLSISGTTFIEDGTGKLLLIRFLDDGTEDLKIVQMGDIDFRFGRLAWNGNNGYFIPFTWLQENNSNLTGYYEFDQEMNYQCSVKLDGQIASTSSAMIAGRENTGIMTGNTENPVPSLPQAYVLKSGWGCQRPPITLKIQEQDNQPWIAYPNPASDQLTIELPSAISAAPVKISCYDPSGRIFSPVYTRSGNSIRISVTELPPALYILRVQMNEQLSHLKFIVSR